MTPMTPTAIDVSFPGGKRIVAACAGFDISCDQPVASGGEDTAPAPFDLFLAALANCAGYFVLEFCNRRGIPTDGLSLRQEIERRDDHSLARVQQTVTLPEGFPAKYESAILRAAASCSIKKVLENPPDIEQVLAARTPA